MNRRVLIPLSLLIALIFILISWPKTSQAGPQKFPLTTEVVGQGQVDLDPDLDAYKRNNMVTIAATPAVGWIFDHWGGDAAGTDNPTRVRISGPTRVIAYFVQDVPPTATPKPGPTPTPGPSATPGPAPDNQVIGYFVQWGIYQRDYLVKNIISSGSAGIVTTINYAFAAIDENLECAGLDPFADYNKAFGDDESVDGVGDSSSQSLKGNFNQLRKLKLSNSDIKVLISLGGWSESYRFSEAALPDNREAFVASCIDMFIHGNFAPGVYGPGIFDGIDVDWEYPGACGATCDFRPEDTENFTALLAEFRNQLDEVDENLLLTIAAPAGDSYYSKIELDQIHPYLDWINVMTYDYHGAWESPLRANHHAPLYYSPDDPTNGGSADETLNGYIAAGVPHDKLNLGVPFYGKGWTRVSRTNDGLFQPAGGIPRGTYEKGTNDFKVLEAKGYPGHWDPIAQAYWIFDGRTFWSYDNETSAANKATYAKVNNLLGVFFWEFSGDDASGTLIHAIDGGLQ